MALSEDPTVEELKELAAKHGNLEVTRDDSLNVGNCESGTDDFIEGCLNGRTTVKVSDLAGHIIARNDKPNDAQSASELVALISHLGRDVVAEAVLSWS